MMTHWKVALLFCVALFMCGCNGILVTKNMKVPNTRQKHYDLSSLNPLISRLANSSSGPLPPIVCIPGVGGSQLSATTLKDRPNPWYCGSSKNWYLVWLALGQLAPGPPLECWMSNVMLDYNASTTIFSNATGVQIMVNYPNSTEGFEYLDPSVKSETAYFAALCAAFVKLGYVRGANLLGAPYDWRLAPILMPQYFLQLQRMIEGAYNVNQTKVAIVAHSMGNLFFLTFLQTVPQEWKDKYILTYIASSPPWVGAFTAIQSLTSGYNFGIPYLVPSTAKAVQRTFASTYFLLPYPKYYSNRLMVSVPGKNYTSENYNDLFTDIGMPQMYDYYVSAFDTANPYQPPGVDTYCLYGYNLSTAIQETYTKNDGFTKPDIKNGDGDGTVPVESLTFCQSWTSQTDKLVAVKGYKGQEHVDLLAYPPFITDVLNAIFNATSKSTPKSSPKSKL